jgi:hypothetical protein
MCLFGHEHETLHGAGSRSVNSSHEVCTRSLLACCSACAQISLYVARTNSIDSIEHISAPELLIKMPQTYCHPAPQATLLSANTKGDTFPTFATMMASATREYHRFRLEPARRTISAACAEYAYFRPAKRHAFFDTPHALPFVPSTTSLISLKSPLPYPDPETMKKDLNTLFDRFLELSSEAADDIYVRIAQEVKDAANDEWSGFGWKVFQKIIGSGLWELRSEAGLVVRGDDLGSLPLLGPAFCDGGRWE